MKCQGQGGAERDVERSEWGMEVRLVNGRPEWNEVCKQQMMETEGMKMEGQMVEGLASHTLHHTPDTLLMPSLSSGYGDSLLC